MDPRPGEMSRVCSVQLTCDKESSYKQAVMISMGRVEPIRDGADFFRDILTKQIAKLKGFI